MKRSAFAVRDRAEKGGPGLPGLGSWKLKAGALLSVVAVAGSAIVGLTLAAAPATAAPGTPGTPQPGSLIYSEDFQNAPTTGAVGILNYTSTTGAKYTADSTYTNASLCNGVVFGHGATDAALQSSGFCVGGTGAGWWPSARTIPAAIGLYNGLTNVNQNLAVAEQTGAGGPTSYIGTMLEGANIRMAAPGRFVTFSLDVGNLCNVGIQALDRFTLLDGSRAIPLNSSDYNICADPTRRTFTVDGQVVSVGTFTGNQASLVTSPTIGFRLSNNQPSGNGNDQAFDNFKILDVTPQLDKSFTPALVRTGNTSTLTFTVTNTAELASKAGWSFTDTLPAGLTLADSTVGGTCAATTAAQAGGTSVAVTNGSLSAGQASCTITVHVTSPVAGSFTNGPGNVTQSGLNPPGSATVTFADPSYTVSKAVSSTTVHPGDKVTYTVTVHNTGTVDYTAAQPASFTDDLSKVLDDAVYNGDATGGATVTGQTLSWSGALAAGATQTITYSVTVDRPDAGDQTLTNAVAPAGPGGACDGSCTTTSKVQSYAVTKTADQTQVTPGEKVVYKVTVKNTGAVDYTAGSPASFSDDLSAVLDDATYNNDADNGATVTGNTLAWSGPLAVGDSVVITYSVTVDTPDTGDQHLNNTVVTPPGVGGDCGSNAGNPACSVMIPSGSFTVSKIASTTQVTAGGTVTYTVTVHNTGSIDYTAQIPASFSDNLGRVLDDAKITAGPDNGATVNGNSVTWAGPLPVGATETISYTVTVDNPDTGDNVLTNTVRPTTTGGLCDPAGTCSTTTDVRAFSVAKAATPAGPVNPGEPVTYTVTVRNTGTAAFDAGTPASFTDDLAGVLDDATITAGPDQGATISGNTLSWSGPLAVDATVVVTYTATVNTPDTGDHVLANTAVAGTGGDCRTGACATTNGVQSYTVAKTASPAGAVHPGDTVTYQVTVKNTGQADYTAADPATVTDDLSDVLDDATYVAGSADNGAVVSGNTLTWSGALPVGATLTISYQVLVGPGGTGNGTLANQAAGDPTKGGSCDPAGSCTTTDGVQAFTVTKTADATEVIPGDKVTYTVTVKNTGAVDYTDVDPAQFSDDLSAVTDDATYDNDADKGATVSGNTLFWSGPLAVGATTVITYSVTVNDPDTGDQHLRNTVVTPPSSGGDCPPNTDNAGCTSLVPSGSYTVSKSASAGTATPGGTLTYTVTVHNTGDVDYTDATPASFRDDLTNVLDDAVISEGPDHGATVSGNTLTWSGPLAAGATVKVTYTVKVASPDTGNHRLVNEVVPTTPGGACDPDGACTTNTPVASYTVNKTVSTTQTVKEGAKVGYTVTVTNTGQSDYTIAAPAAFKDDMSDVLDDATYNGDATDGAVLDGKTLRWSGALAIGAVVKVTYSVTVNSPDAGNHRLRNTVDPAVAGGGCDPSGSCATDTAIAPPPPGTGLAFTGSDLVAPGLLAVLLLGAGAAFLAIRRRRAAE